MVAAVALATLGVPLALIAVWIKLDSRGPVFFRQERVGRRGQRFRIHKFRTMVVGWAGKSSEITTRDDPRVTRAGRFLRRYKLDELPQLLDVLVGDMSLVGPRPEVPKFIELYEQHALAEVLSVRPGITDEASIEFRDESELLGAGSDAERIYVEMILPRKIELYRKYVRTRTFLGDLRILLRTGTAIFQR